MATYAIGDIQGCYDELQQLLELIQFDPQKDRLWFAGDLVNRGPKSLETLRFIKGLGDAAITVLGNHDLHLIALWKNRHRHTRGNKLLAPVLKAKDADELLDWLRRQPLMHYDESFDVALVHAGLPPQWSIDKALKRAAEVEKVLRGPKLREFLSHMYGNKPTRWSKKLGGWDRLRFIVNCFTRMRYCTVKGGLDFNSKGKPDFNEKNIVPWFTAPKRKSAEQTIVFGHWSTLGLYQGNNVYAIDSGCLWGGSLTALRLDDRQLISLPCKGYSTP